MWIYLSTDLTCSAESEESASHLKTTCDPAAIAKSIPIVEQSSYLEWLWVTWCMPQFGTISKLCESDPKKSISTSSMGDFPARILALQEMEKAWQESEADYFSRSCAWPKNSSPNSYSLRTQTSSQQEEAQKSLNRLPISGLIVDGSLRKLERKERHKYGKDGFVWPTPTASQASKPIRFPSPSRTKKEHGYDLQDKIGEIYPNLIGKRINPQFLEWLMGYPLGWTEPEPWAMQFVSLNVQRLSRN